MIVVFSSGLHGSGRSYLADKFSEYLIRKGYRVLRLSSGEIFRKIAKERGFKSIEDFVKYLNDNPDESIKIDVEVDRRMISEIKSNLQKYDYIVVDSNLAPFYSKKLGEAVNILVYTKPEVIAQRVFARRREMDKQYDTLDDVIRELILRTRRDIERYKKLSEVESELKEIYKIGYTVLKKALDFSLKDGELPEDLKKYFDFIVDNNGSIENTLIQISNFLKL